MGLLNFKVNKGKPTMELNFRKGSFMDNVVQNSSMKEEDKVAKFEKREENLMRKNQMREDKIEKSRQRLRHFGF